MKEARRGFLLMAAAAGFAIAEGGALFAQIPTKKSPFPDPPAPAEQQNPAEIAAASQDQKAAKRAALQQDAKQFRAGVEKLYDMASELKQDLEKTPTMDVFSLEMYKKTVEIEKLAKQLKAHAKG